VKRALGIRVLPDFPYAALAALCLVIAVSGCNTSSSPPPDTVPPTAPGSLTVTAASTTQINLSWTASTDNVGVAGYKVERCSGAACSSFTQIATPTTTAYSDMGLTPSTSYSYRVRATDAAGNLSAYSNSGTVSTPAPPIQVSLSLTSASVQAGIGTQSFTATVQNDAQNLGVKWTLSGTGCTGAACGSLSSNSSLSGIAITYSAPLSQPSPSRVMLTATSVSDTSKSMPATITVTPAVSVSVSPTPINIQFNAIQFFTATVQNDAANAGVQWSLSGSGCSGSSCGTLSASASLSGVPIKYTGPSGVPAPPGVTLTATSVTDPARNAPAAITVSPNPGTTAVTISPVRAAITKWQTQTFTPTVTGASNMAVSWYVDTFLGGNASVGTIDATGKYTPPSTAGAHTITAVSNADVTKIATAPIGVTDLAGVTTYHNDVSRTGANIQEYGLTNTLVTPVTFGKLFSCNADAAIYAQPLWVANLTIGGGSHNVVFVATERDTVYAFDADTNPCVTYWKTGANGVNSLLPSGETWSTSADVGNCGDLTPDIGVTSTPVIDSVTGTIYVLTKSKVSATGAMHQRLHALNLVTGAEKFGGPMEITATVPGNGDASTGNPPQISFDPLREGQRPALLLSNDATGKHIVIAWASHCDFSPYHGWVMSYNASTLAQEAVFNTSPTKLSPDNGSLAGVWMSGDGPAADSGGNIFFATGNGAWDGLSDFGDSIVKLGPPSAGAFPAASFDYFTPLNQNSLNSVDEDLGSGGLLLLPDVAGTHPHLLVQAGKEGKIYLISRDTGTMGHFCTACTTVDTQIVQELPAGTVGGMWDTPAYWNHIVYFGGNGDVIKSFSFNTGAATLISTAPISQSNNSFNFPGTTPSVSASGMTNGIVWALDTSNCGSLGNCSGLGAAVLHAYDATSLNTELWNSTQGSGNAAGVAVKFAVPTVANGKVYVGARGNDPGDGSGTLLGELDVYGLLPN
jgi:chitodextrinase